MRPALEAAAVPSQFDFVVFPTDTNSYYVDIDYDESITVGKLNFRLQVSTACVTLCDTSGSYQNVTRQSSNKEFTYKYLKSLNINE